MLQKLYLRGKKYISVFLRVCVFIKNRSICLMIFIYALILMK